jgi:glycolate oxidase FAD binding subunit
LVVSEVLAGWGVSPRTTERPDRPATLAALVRAARQSGDGLLPVGGGTALSAGGRPGPAEQIVDFSQLARIVRVIPGDLTVTVEAGASLASLHAALAEAGLHLPGGGSRRGTVGGLLASGFTTLEAGLQHGSLRERVLGLTVVDGHGVLSRSGGSVVKNVTGYDLHRVHAGPGGALGFLVEITLRLEPLPEDWRHLSVDAGSVGAADALWRRLRTEGPEPVAVQITPNRAGLGDSVRVDVHLAGDREVVESQSSWLRDRLGFQATEPAAGWEDGDVPEGHPGGWQAVVRTAAREWVGSVETLCGTPDTASELWHGVAAAALEGRWQYRIEREPAGATGELPAWSADPAALRLLARWKKSVDPAGILRPGSYSAEHLERAASFFDEASLVGGSS